MCGWNAEREQSILNIYLVSTENKLNKILNTFGDSSIT